MMQTSTSAAPVRRNPVIVQVQRAGMPAPPDAKAAAALREALLASLPEAPTVLEIGADAALRAAYLARHPAAQWIALDPDARDAGVAGLPEQAFALIVVSLALDEFVDPLQLLRDLAAFAMPDAPLVAAAANAADWSGLARHVEGDLSGDAADAWDGPGRHRFSPASLYKLMLDAGWLPAIAQPVAAAAPGADLAQAALAIAEASGVPRGTAQRTLSIGQIVVRALRRFDALPREEGPARFTVVVPTTRETQLRLNIERSPGLREVGARIVTCRGAADPAQALETALPSCEGDWVLLCHQDVYFPAGFGEQLNAVLAAVAPAAREHTLIGFAGMAINAAGNDYAEAGFVIDRLHRFDHAGSDRAVSIDELAIVVARQSVHRIDPAMGWHLWATELCLASICRHQTFARIVRLPLFHNSLNDYRLPESFHAAGRRLAAKYPAFGPIATLCGVIPPLPVEPAKPVFAAPPPAPQAQAQVQHHSASLSAELPEASAAIERAMQAGHFAQAMQLMAAAVHQHYVRPEVSHHCLYYPGLDAQLEQMADLLAAREPLDPSREPAQGELLIATELYALGGHTRVLQDIAAELAEPTIVLTDLFKTCENEARQVQWVKSLFPRGNVLVLPQGSAWDKARMLRRFAHALNPRCIVYLAHHQDPVPYVGTLASRAPNKVFVHHGDHNPSLGCTIARLRHVDLSDGVRELCAARLDSAPVTLPLHVEDRGRKAFAPLQPGPFSVVTSGHPAKFARQGEVSLERIVTATLTACGGTHTHIGPLDDAWVAEIRAALATRGIAGKRFVHLGWVPSLWQALKDLDAAFYIGSAPLGGGRAAVEAQGCGYPVVYFENAAHTALPANHPLYASRELGWTSVESLATVLAAAAPRHADLSDAARRLYEEGFSGVPFRRALDAILRG